MEQEKNEDWQKMVNLERYHMVSESEILQKLNNENPSRNININEHAMMAWENLKEPINENDTEDSDSLEDEKYKKRIQKKKKKLMMNSHKHLPQLIMIALNKKESKDCILLRGNMKTETQCIKFRNWKETPERKD